MTITVEQLGEEFEQLRSSELSRMRDILAVSSSFDPSYYHKVVEYLERGLEGAWRLFEGENLRIADLAYPLYLATQLYWRARHEGLDRAMLWKLGHVPKAPRW